MFIGLLRRRRFSSASTFIDRLAAAVAAGLVWIVGCAAQLANPLQAAAVESAANLAVATLFPAADSKDVCPDTPLRMTFSSAPVVGAGTIEVFDAANDALVDTIDVAVPTRRKTIGGFPNFNYHPVLISENQATIYLPDHLLGYNKTYYVKIASGAFEDRDGNANDRARRPKRLAILDEGLAAARRREKTDRRRRWHGRLRHGARGHRFCAGGEPRTGDDFHSQRHVQRNRLLHQSKQRDLPRRRSEENHHRLRQQRSVQQ